MHKTRFFSVLLFVSLLLVLLPATAKALWDVPVGPGESFRWVFVTSQARDATSTDIGDYNWFVNWVADLANTPITGVVGKASIAEIDWRAIGSVYTTRAIDNIGASSSGIYTPLGDIVAHGTAAMFACNAILESPIIYNEYGSVYAGPVFTGTGPTGHHAPMYPLGSIEGYSMIGNSSYVYSARWIFDDWWSNDAKAPMYAISEELSVVPAPGALILAATGLLSVRLGLKRLRRKHPE